MDIILKNLTELENALDGLSQKSKLSTDTTKSGVMVTTSQEMLADSRATMLKSMVLMISLGDQMDIVTHTLITIPSTTGMTKVMDISAMDVVVTDADSAEDTVTDTPRLLGDTTVTTSRRDSVSVTTTPTSVTR
jgi:hypothetical protein